MRGECACANLLRPLRLLADAGEVFNGIEHAVLLHGVLDVRVEQQRVRLTVDVLHHQLRSGGEHRDSERGEIPSTLFPTAGATPEGMSPYLKSVEAAKQSRARTNGKVSSEHDSKIDVWPDEVHSVAKNISTGC